jgi:hypothetical protein
MENAEMARGQEYEGWANEQAVKNLCSPVSIRGPNNQLNLN